MQVTGRIVDAITGAPVPGVSVGVVNEAGEYVGPGTYTDDLGRFSLDNDLLTPTGSYFMLLTHVSYSSVSVDPTGFLTTPDFGMIPQEAGVLEDFIVTAPKPANNAFTLLLIAAGIYVIYKIS